MDFNSIRLLVLSFLLVCSHGLRADLNQLDFMLGHWQSPDFGEGATEIWTGSDTSMAGVFYGVLNDTRVITEFMLIQPSEEGAVLRWNHFNEDFSRWESEPIEHHLVESGPGFAKFEMKVVQKGLPRHLIYQRTEKTLVVWVGDAANPEGAFQITFTQAE